MTEMPEAVTLGYQRIALCLSECLGENRGLYEHGGGLRPTIWLDADIVGSTLAQTALHEVGHAIVENYLPAGTLDEEVEEMIVDTMAKGLVQVMRDNPAFIAWLMERIATEK